MATGGQFPRQHAARLVSDARPIDAEKPLTLLVLAMWPSSALCSIGRKARVL